MQFILCLGILTAEECVVHTQPKIKRIRALVPFLMIIGTPYTILIL